MRRKVLWRGSIRIGLAFLWRFDVLVFHRSGQHFAVVLFEMFTLGGVGFLVGSEMLIRVVKFVGMKLFVVRCFVMFSGASQGLTRKYFHGGTNGRG
jgi:hypothetical protein